MVNTERASTSALSEFFFVRHGARLDQLDFRWRETASVPYDTPITREGVEQARLTGHEVIKHSACASRSSTHPAWGRPTSKSGHHRFIIHTSPFLRCVQTALALAATVESLTGTRPLLRLDCFLGEWMTPDYYTEIRAPPPMPELATTTRRYLEGRWQSSTSRTASEAPAPSFMRPFQVTDDAHTRARASDLDFDLDKVQVDWDWDATLFGSGGTYGEDWPEMHRRFRSSLRHLIDHYSRAECPETERDAVVVMVTHSAGCNAMIRAVSGRPVLQDVGLSSLSHAVLKSAKSSMPALLVHDHDHDNDGTTTTTTTTTADSG